MLHLEIGVENKLGINSTSRLFQYLIGRKLRESMLGVALKASAQVQSTGEKIKGAVNTAISSKGSEGTAPRQAEDEPNNN